MDQDNSTDQNEQGQASVPDQQNENLTYTAPASPNRVSSDDIDEETSKVGLFIVVGIVVLVLAIVGWLALGGGDDTATLEDNANTVNTPTDNTNNPVSLKRTEADSNILGDILYAHADTSGEEKDLFSRPAKGGEVFDEKGTLPAYANSFAVTGQKRGYVFASDDQKEIWFGSADENPRKVYTVPNSIQLISTVRLSNDGRSIAFSLFDSTLNSNNFDTPQIWTVAPNGTSPSLFYEGKVADGPGFYIDAFAGDTQTAYFTQSCVACDGVIRSVQSYNSSEGLVSIVDPDESIGRVQSIAFNPNFSKILWVASDNPSTAGLGETGPFTLVETNVSSGEHTKLLTFGKDGDLSPADRQIGYAQTDSGERPYYAFEDKLYMVNGSDESVMFESGQGDVSSVYFLSDKQVLVGTGDLSGGEVINYFDLKKQKASIVMETSADSIILSITRQ